MKFAVIVFPGSNCDDDMVHVLGTVMGADVVKVWHKDTHLPEGFTKQDCVIVPCGFSYGDYVRSGAIAYCQGLYCVIRTKSSFVKIFGLRRRLPSLP